tara:strand:+ start:498 stop:860 length:363 start_codon:yes stop_codon:yes gene_type:complete
MILARLRLTTLVRQGVAILLIAALAAIGLPLRGETAGGAAHANGSALSHQGHHGDGASPPDQVAIAACCDVQAGQCLGSFVGPGVSAAATPEPFVTGVRPGRDDPSAGRRHDVELPPPRV